MTDEEIADEIMDTLGDDRTRPEWLRLYIQQIRAAERAAVIEECAKIADSYSCGSCGMDGKTTTEIRNLSQQPTGRREGL